MNNVIPYGWLIYLGSVVLECLIMWAEQPFVREVNKINGTCNPITILQPDNILQYGECLHLACGPVLWPLPPQFQVKRLVHPWAMQYFVCLAYFLHSNRSQCATFCNHVWAFILLRVGDHWRDNDDRSLMIKKQGNNNLDDCQLRLFVLHSEPLQGPDSNCVYTWAWTDCSKSTCSACKSMTRTPQGKQHVMSMLSHG